MRRSLALFLVVLMLLVPASALAQSAFGPLPQAVEPTATPTAVQSTADQGHVNRTLLLGIAGVVALVFLGIGTYISRDARRNLTADDRRELERKKTPSERQAQQKARDRKRQQVRARKQARKKQRR